MPLRPEYSLGHSEYNAFLFASVGEEKSGLQLTRPRRAHRPANVTSGRVVMHASRRVDAQARHGQTDALVGQPLN